jgi:methylenetetrahydrofolate reductase (NADPH)
MLSIPISFEVYPPREPEAAPALFEAIDRLAELNPSFISVTFGAGGSDTNGSIEVLSYIKNQTQAVPLAHLTCVGTTEKESRSTIQQFLDAGIGDFLALRGDLPQGQTQLAPDSLANASELVGVIRNVANVPGSKIAVAAFPNGHPESGVERSDLVALKAKQDAGADFAITQLFFYAEDYFNFLELARSYGITIPIVPGIMPITSAKRLSRVLELTGEREPTELAQALEAAEDASERLEVGVSWAANLVAELAAGGAPGIHLYAFNEHENVTEVLRRAGLV